jgi:hypothetical protein
MSIKIRMTARHAHWDQFEHHVTCDAKKLTYPVEYGHDGEARDLSEIAFPIPFPGGPILWTLSEKELEYQGPDPDLIFGA